MLAYLGQLPGGPKIVVGSPFGDVFRIVIELIGTADGSGEREDCEAHGGAGGEQSSNGVFRCHNFGRL